MNIRLLFALLLLLALPTPGRAENFTISDLDGNVQLQFAVPTSPEVYDFAEGEYFETQGTSDLFGTVFVGFSSPDYFAQLILGGSFGLLYFNAPQLYTGSEDAPTLLDGSFDLTSLEGLSYTLDVTSNTATTPEASSLTLCATGGALLMAAFLQRRQRALHATAAPRLALHAAL